MGSPIRDLRLTAGISQAERARRTSRPDSDRGLVVTRSPGTGLLTIAAFAADAGDLWGVEVDGVTDGGFHAHHGILVTAAAI